MPRHRLGVIAGGDRHDAGGTLFGRQQGQAIGGTAFLERAGDLQGVELQPHVGPGDPADRIAMDDRGANHLSGNARGSRLNVIKPDHCPILPVPFAPLHLFPSIRSATVSAPTTAVSLPARTVTTRIGR